MNRRSLLKRIGGGIAAAFIPFPRPSKFRYQLASRGYSELSWPELASEVFRQGFYSVLPSNWRELWNVSECRFNVDFGKHAETYARMFRVKKSEAGLAEARKAGQGAAAKLISLLECHGCKFVAYALTVSFCGSEPCPTALDWQEEGDEIVLRTYMDVGVSWEISRNEQS